ncbi:hypothetical protein CPter91_5156 [Collimonas pratensis]|uniref:Uncharacterized protein n=1 Tax=Collimonas pratensis TaxID=279113 RepID=A0A127QBQ1_9BURK|nr:hypothetical protein CPter91_5156 [Collimonas pratensis]
MTLALATAACTEPNKEAGAGRPRPSMFSLSNRKNQTFNPIPEIAFMAT